MDFPKIYPFETYLQKHETNLPMDSKAKANQVRTVDKKRLGKISAERMADVESAISIHLGLR